MPSQEDRIECPHCAELILPKAKICRYCKSDLTPPPTEDIGTPSEIMEQIKAVAEEDDTLGFFGGAFVGFLTSILMSLGLCLTLFLFGIIVSLLWLIPVIGWIIAILVKIGVFIRLVITGFQLFFRHVKEWQENGVGYFFGNIIGLTSGATLVVITPWLLVFSLKVGFAVTAYHFILHHLDRLTPLMEMVGHYF